MNLNTQRQPMLRYRFLRRMSGFTLLEMLIGMTLLGVMMALLFGSLRVCVQNWDAGEDKIAEVSQATVIQAFFSNHLQNLLPLQDKFSKPTDEALAGKIPLSFQGDVSSIQFVSSMPASAGRLGLQLFTVGIDDAKAKNRSISVSMQPFFPVTEGNDWKIEKVSILKDVKSLTFSYFGADTDGASLAEPPKWQATWMEKTQTPLLVKIDIELLNGVRWPELIVAVMVDSNTAVMANPFGIVNDRFVR